MPERAGDNDARERAQDANADGEREATRAPEPPPRVRRHRPVPFLWFLGYYAVIIGVGALLVARVPLAKRAFAAPLNLPADMTLGRKSATQALESSPELIMAEGWERGAVTGLTILGALAMVLPVAWVYMFTRRLSYDPSLVQSVVVLPLVVSGITVVVKNSLAMAFALAGIVAGVRFRQALKDPKDAAYILLALGIGLAAGVQAMDIAVVMSLGFNVVVLMLWKYDLGAIYSGGGRRGLLAMGNTSLLQMRSARQRNRLRRRMKKESEGMKTDGVLVVHASDPAAARRAVEVALTGVAKEWRVIGPESRRDGVATLNVLVRMKKKGDPVKLLGELEERWSGHVNAAEYVPFKTEKS